MASYFYSNRGSDYLRRTPTENRYQSKLISKLKERYGDAYIYKTSPYAPQGFPDITIVHESGKWAYLECKRSRDESRQPNQTYYVDRLNRFGFASFIFPENEECVLNELDEYLNPCKW